MRTEWSNHGMPISIGLMLIGGVASNGYILIFGLLLLLIWVFTARIGR